MNDDCQSSRRVSALRLRRFLRGYAELRDSEDARLRRHFTRFAGGHRRAVAATRKEQRRTATDIYFLRPFKIDEMGHSQMLAFFLDPLADHAQGSLFLRALALVANGRERDTVLPEIYATGRYTVTTESCLTVDKSRPRTDIEIRGATPDGQKFVVHIENKVTAVPTRRQIETEWRGIADGCVSGERPHGLLLSPAKPDWLARTRFGWIGWRDVAAALREFARHAAAPRARFAAEQYRRLIEDRIIAVERRVADGGKED